GGGYGGADAHELGLGIRKPRGPERRAVERGRGRAAKVADAAAQDGGRGAVGAADHPGEADARRDVHFARGPVRADAEERVRGPVVCGRAVEAGGLEPRAVTQLEATAPPPAAPGVAHVERAVPCRARPLEGG